MLSGVRNLQADMSLTPHTGYLSNMIIAYVKTTNNSPGIHPAGAAQVIACEWNPNAVEALRKNLQLNGVADRCKVLVGDCTLTAPKVGMAVVKLASAQMFL